MAKVYLLRHGATNNNLRGITQDWNDDISLTADAQRELELAVPGMLEKLSSKSVIVLCSPMQRAKETAAPLIKALTFRAKNVHMSIDDRLAEVNFGDFGGCYEDQVLNGKSMQDFRVDTQMWYAAQNYFAYPNGETVIDISNRCQEFLHTLAERIEVSGIDDYDIVVVGHNRLFRHLLVELGIWDYTNMFNDKLPHATLVPVSIAGISKFK